MNATYILLMITTIIALCCKDKKPAYLFIVITNLVGWYQGIIDHIGLCFLALFASTTYSCFTFQQLSKPVKILLFIIEFLSIVALATHCVPGFFNLLVMHSIKLSPLSIPFSMYLNFDKAMGVLIIYCLSDLYTLEKKTNLGYGTIIKYTTLAYLLSIVLVLIPAYISGYILFDPGLPDILSTWAMNNFFLVCMGEEIIFRGCLQSRLQNALKKYGNKSGWLAIMITSFLFGIAHFQGGLTYIGLATIASGCYGYAYYKTGKIVCAMIVHFGLNLVHLLLFTYPMAIHQ